MHNSNFLKQDKVLAKKYEIIRTIKQGGFGIVYLVNDLEHDRKLVLKELFFMRYSFRRMNGTVNTEQKASILFKKLKNDIKIEVKTLKVIDNRNIVKVYDFFEENGTIYSVMEYIDGLDLEECFKDKIFNEDEIKDLLKQLICGLKELHCNSMIHRDIKPSNIMKCETGAYKIIDFTTSKVYSNQVTTITGIRSPSYCPPELDTTRAEIGKFSDIYSIGMTLIRGLHGKSIPNLTDRLINDDSFQDLIINLNISEKLKNIILKMTYLDFEKRFQNLEEIEDILFKKGKKMAYLEKMSSANPGCIIIMIDQSGSMADPYGNSGEKKKDLAALAVNRVIYEIAEASSDGEGIKDRCFIGVIGYGVKSTGVDLILGDMISNIAENPLRVEKIKKKISDGAGGLIEIDEDFPIWVEPKADWGTPMDSAFKRASQLTQEWCKEHPDSFPPLVINITDGEPNDIDGAKREAENLVSLSNNDGNVLLLNAHIANGLSDPIKLPSDVTVLSDSLAQFLFEISSVLPDVLLGEAQKVGFNTVSGAKGMVYNADAEVLIRLLNFGSSIAR